MLLSGYKQFDYVKNSLEYNAETYMLKPTNLNEVESFKENLIRAC